MFDALSVNPWGRDILRTASRCRRIPVALDTFAARSDSHRADTPHSDGRHARHTRWAAQCGTHRSPHL
jgi:hypothetical protein